MSDFLAGIDREKNIARAIEMIKAEGLIEQSYRQAKEYSDKAVRLLDTLPSNACREGLKSLTAYLVRRRI